MSDPPIVVVHWLDSTLLHAGQWLNLDDVQPELEPDRLVVESVGYLVAQGPTAIALAGSRTRYGDDYIEKVAEVQVILVAAIIGGPWPLSRNRRRAVTLDRNPNRGGVMNEEQQQQQQTEQQQREAEAERERKQAEQERQRKQTERPAEGEPGDEDE